MATTPKTVLCSAYAVNPYHGSEDGMGWNFIMQIARFNNVIAVTRINTASEIMRYMAENPSPYYERIRFVYFDLPGWASWWKRGHKNALIYYWLWQYFLPVYIKKMKLEYDIVHNLNFHNDWTPSRLYLLRKPFVWGPVGHHPRIPKNYIKPVYGWRTYLIEELKWIVKNYFWKADPLLRKTVNKADAILAMNSSVEKVMNLRGQHVYRLSSVSADSIHVQTKSEKDKSFIIFSAGRFVPLKGFDITIKSFARYYCYLDNDQKETTKLIIVGDGPLKTYLLNLTHELEIQNAVEFLEPMPREMFLYKMAQSDVFLFPSHEGAGMVVTEAMAAGLPVICFNNEGPGEIVTRECGITVPYSRYNDSITRFANALTTLRENKSLYDYYALHSRMRFEEKYNWNTKGEVLDSIYNNVLQKAS